MNTDLSIKAGRKALALLRDEGLQLDRVKVLAGASGAAKYLVLSGIDILLMALLAKRVTPLHTIGTSIGAFRMACFCHPEPQQAYERLQHAYIHQHYPVRPSAEEVSLKSKGIVNAFIADSDIPPILEHPSMRLNFLSNKCKGLLARDNPVLQGVGLALAGMSNCISRDALGWYFERALFHSPGTIPPFAAMDQFAMQSHALTQKNFKQALLSSGSIPIVMQGVREIDGIAGVFRDGGIIDYHLDIPFLPSEDDGLVLYPHFYPQITPGWFDKRLKRSAKPEHLDHLVLISPKQSFIESLPHQKIPDRTDFKSFHHDDQQRIAYWQKTVDMSQRLGDELHRLIETGAISARVEPL